MRKYKEEADVVIGINWKRKKKVVEIIWRG
jgi:hypothetical protein